MSKQFTATAIYVLMEATPYHEKGTVFAQHEDGLFVFDFKYKHIDYLTQRNLFMFSGTSALLWRDYWRFFYNNAEPDSEHGVFYTSAMQVPVLDYRTNKRLESIPRP